MSRAGTRSTHIDYLPGWRYLTMALEDDSALKDEYVAVFDQIIAGTLAGHPYRLYRGECWVIVGVAPPAAEAMTRVEQAMAAQLGAFDDPQADNSN
jgi:hypothetical protein